MLVGFFQQQAEPSELRVPGSQGRYPLLAYIAGNGFGFFEHLSNELVFLTKRKTFLTAQAGVGFL